MSLSEHGEDGARADMSLVAMIRNVIAKLDKAPRTKPSDAVNT